MKTGLQVESIKLFVLIFFLFSSITVIGQDNKFIGTKKITNGNKSFFETIPQKNISTYQTLEENKTPVNSYNKDRFVLDGNVLWSFQDGLAIANVTELNSDGTLPLTGWGLNTMRVSRYTDVNNIPLWEYPTAPYDPNVDVSDDGSVIAATQGTDFYLLDNLTGAVKYQMTMPDTLYATPAKRDIRYCQHKLQSEG